MDEEIARLTKRVTHLEERVAFQDDLLEQLNEVVIEQGARIDKLIATLKALEHEVTLAGEPGDAPAHDPPPHY